MLFKADRLQPGVSSLAFLASFVYLFPPQVKDFGAPHGLYAMVAVLRFLLLGEKVTPFYHKKNIFRN